jgi:hypothetical protein
VDARRVARLLDGHPEAHLTDALQVQVVHGRHHAGRLGGSRRDERDQRGREQGGGEKAGCHARAG